MLVNNYLQNCVFNMRRMQILFLECILLLLYYCQLSVWVFTCLPLWTESSVIRQE